MKDRKDKMVMLNRLHPDDVEVFHQFESLTSAAAAYFNLPLKKVEPVAYPHRAVLGLCSNSGRVRLRIRLKTKGQWSQVRDHYGNIVQTIVHELAHLKEFNHGPEHSALTKKIFDYIMFRRG
jgi:hypothetical protein